MTLPQTAASSGDLFQPAFHPGAATAQPWVRPIRANRTALQPTLRARAAECVLAEAFELRDGIDGDRAIRVLNICVAAIGLVLLAPVILVIAIAIRLTSRGPVFYAQERVGIDRRSRRVANGFDRRAQDLGGRVFRMYKFRTMVLDAEADGRAVLARRNDNRVTAIGRVLRASRLDEVPQLWNVLRGEMNVVGPRPERPSIFADLREMVPFYHLRQRVLPGITGWAQINQSYDETLEDVRRKTALDLEYLRNRSVVRDLRIMVHTLPVMAAKSLGW